MKGIAGIRSTADYRRLALWSCFTCSAPISPAAFLLLLDSGGGSTPDHGWDGMRWNDEKGREEKVNWTVSGVKMGEGTSVGPRKQRFDWVHWWGRGGGSLKHLVGSLRPYNLPNHQASYDSYSPGYYMPSSRTPPRWQEGRWGRHL